MTNKNKYIEREQELILKAARLEASKAVLMQALAFLARKVNEEDLKFIQAAIKSADNAALRVSWDDLYDTDDLKLN